MHKIKKLDSSSIDLVMECIEDARLLLRNSGSLQWNTPDGYPTKDDMLKDILKGNLYGYVDQTGIRGICAIVIGEDENYKTIDGAWTDLSNTYVAIHRIAVRKDSYGSGVSISLVEHAKEIMRSNNLKSIKGDTHKINIPMQKLLLKCGFKRTGVITLLRTKIDNLREAFEYNE